MLLIGVLVSLLLVSNETVAAAQTWNEVQASIQSYLWAEGWGNSVEEADREALSALAGKISLTVVSSFRSVEGKASRGNDTAGYSEIESSFRTYSSVSLAEAGVEVLERGRSCRVVRWISRDEVERMRERRIAQVKEYVSEAMENERAGWISAALRGYYWAYALVRACPELALCALEGVGRDGMLMSDWLPVKVNELLSGLRAAVVSTYAGQTTLEFTYNGRKALGTEFSFFDGCRWSEAVTAYDGRSTVRLHYNTPPEYLHLMIEYKFRDEVRSDSELGHAIDYIGEEPMRKAHSTVYNYARSR